MRIVIVTDAWFPQINGVVRTLNTLTSKLSNFGHNVRFITPNDFRTLPCPTYPEVRLALCRPGSVGQRIEDSRPDAVHIATEEPLGWAARTFCRRQGHPFTTSFHTRFPEYVHARWRVPLPLSYALLRRFHSAASRVMVATPSLEKDLKQRGFANIHRWSRGVDTDLFRPRPKDFLACPRPISRLCCTNK